MSGMRYRIHMFTISNGSKGVRRNRSRAIVACLFSTLLAAAIMLGGAAFISAKSQPAPTPYYTPELEQDEFAFIEVLPLQLVAEISHVVDDRPLIDRLTVEMISEIPLESQHIYRDDLEPQLEY